LILAGSMDESVSGMFEGSMIGMVLRGGEARAAGIRIVALALVGVGAWRSRCTLSSAMALAGAVAAATSFAWIGHAWAARNGGLSVALLSVHLVGVAFWVGALTPLLLVGRRGDLETLAGTARRFGAIAVYVVVSLLFAGGLLLCTLLTHITELWTTDYGRLVCMKLLAVAALLSAAAWNKLRLTTRLQGHDLCAFVGLLRSVKVEMLLAALILGITATMTTLVGPGT
jgi:putative copper export protein